MTRMGDHEGTLARALQLQEPQPQTWARRVHAAGWGGVENTGQEEKTAERAKSVTQRRLSITDTCLTPPPPPYLTKHTHTLKWGGWGSGTEERRKRGEGGDFVGTDDDNVP